MTFRKHNYCRLGVQTLLGFCLLLIGCSEALANTSKDFGSSASHLIAQRVQSNVHSHMPAAISRARESLDEFLALYRNPKSGMKGFKLKVFVSDMFGEEQFWVTPFSITKAGFEGTIATDPKVVKKVAFGQKLNFKREDIRDWGYTLNGKQYGSYTTCVLIDNLSKDEADYFRTDYGFICQ